MSRLGLYSLGMPRINLDASVVEVDTRKAVALPEYLAVTGETHRGSARTVAQCNLFIDDLHCADDASLDLLIYPVCPLHGRPPCVLVTWHADHVKAGHRLRLTLS